MNLNDDEILEIPLRVGEAPRDITVGSGYESRHPRQGEAADGTIGPVHLHAIPDAGRGQGQVHVVGEDRPAVQAALTGHRPVVRADHDFTDIHKTEAHLMGANVNAFRIDQTLNPILIVIPRSTPNINHIRPGNCHRLVARRFFPGSVRQDGNVETRAQRGEKGEQRLR